VSASALRASLYENIMSLRAPNIALFVIAWCLAMLGVLAAPPIALPIPGVSSNSAWYIFLGWFLLAAGAVLARLDSSGAEAHDKDRPHLLNRTDPSGKPVIFIGTRRDADTR
jgi:hypothetical protein